MAFLPAEIQTQNAIDNTKVSGSANLTLPVYLSGDNFLPGVFTKAAARREINANWLPMTLTCRVLELEVMGG